MGGIVTFLLSIPFSYLPCLFACSVCLFCTSAPTFFVRAIIMFGNMCELVFTTDCKCQDRSITILQLCSQSSNILRRPQNSAKSPPYFCLMNLVPVKNKVEILQNFMAFSEYMNFTIYCKV